jgi:hypothetical protein
MNQNLTKSLPKNLHRFHQTLISLLMLAASLAFAWDAKGAMPGKHSNRRAAVARQDHPDGKEQPPHRREPGFGRAQQRANFAGRRTGKSPHAAWWAASGINEIGDPSGPGGIYLQGRTLYILNGEGDATLAGPIPGTELPNPNPSSPILSSVLALHFSAEAEQSTTGFTLTAC